VADLHEITFALEAHEAAKRLKQAPAPDVPFWKLFPLWRALLGIALLALNVWAWWLILFG